MGEGQADLRRPDGDGTGVIAVIPIDLDGSGCYRVLFPSRELRRNGIPSAMPPAQTARTGDGGYLFRFQLVPPEQMAKRITTLVVQRSIQELWALEYMPALRRLGVRVVFETDDLMVGLPKWHPAREGLENATAWIEKGLRGSLDMMTKAMNASDTVVVSTPYLAEVHGGHHPDVRVVRNRLCREMWEDVPMQYEQERRRFRIGYMGSASFHRGDLEVLRGVIGPWLERHPDVEFVACGDGRTHDLLGVPERQRVTVAPLAFHHMELPDIVAVMDVGLVPLDLCAFNEAKSCLKGMEYAAAGIPCIASPTSEYLWWAEQNGGCMIADRNRPAAWRSCLDAFYEEDALRRAVGATARRDVEKHWIQDNWQEWRDAWTASG